MASLYGSRWKAARADYLGSHGLCVACAQIGRATQAKCVDHITAHKGDLELFWDTDNWQALCWACHSRKTARRDGGYGNKASTKPAPGCRADGIPLDKRHHWHR